MILIFDDDDINVEVQKLMKMCIGTQSIRHFPLIRIDARTCEFVVNINFRLGNGIVLGASPGIVRSGRGFSLGKRMRVRKIRPDTIHKSVRLAHAATFGIGTHDSPNNT